MTRDEINAVKKAAAKMREENSMQEEIIKMARQAGAFEVDEVNPQCFIGDIAFALEGLEAFAKLVAAKEREACALLAATPVGTIAKAIRARGEA